MTNDDTDAGIVPEHRPVTLAMIARRAGCSVITVSRALRGDRDHVSDEKIAHIVGLAQAMGYDSSAQDPARRLRLSRNGVAPLRHAIGVVFPPAFMEATPYFTEILHGIMAVLTAARFAVVCVQLEEHLETMPLFSRGDIDGLIYTGSLQTSLPVFASLAERACRPFPQVSIVLKNPQGACIAADDALGGYAMAGHVLDQGHRHALIFPIPNHTARLSGYARAWRERGYDPDVMLYPCTRWLPFTRYLGPYRRQHHQPPPNAVLWSVLQPTLVAHPEITTIFAPNDWWAVRIYHALHEQGIRMPQDISLTGFDDTECITTDAHVNILTTVHVPLHEIGKEAADLALRQLRNEAPLDAQVTLPTRFVERASVKRIAP